MRTREFPAGVSDAIAPLLASQAPGATRGLRSARLTATHTAMPSVQSPSLLVPISPARAAVATLQNYTTPSTAIARLKLSTVTLLARAGMLRLAPWGIRLGGPGTFIEHLHSVLDLDFLVASVQLGPPRINRKPVLRMMDGSGQAVAFVKLGVSSLTCERVRTETSALRRLEQVPTPGLVTPAVLAAGEWHGLDYLVLEPLDTSGAVADPELRRRAGSALVDAFPIERSILASADWWQRTWARLESCDPNDADVQRLSRVGKVLLERHGTTEISIGAGHGDWSPWNTCAAGGAVVAWDWERFSTDLPIGWDEIHYRASACRMGVAAGLIQLHKRIIEKHGLGSDREAVFALYLMYRGTNFVFEQHQRTGSPNGPLSTWLLPALESAVASTGPA